MPDSYNVDGAADTYSADLYDTGTSVTVETLDEKKYHLEEQTIAARSLLTSDGIRFIYASLIPNFRILPEV